MSENFFGIPLPDGMLEAYQRQRDQQMMANEIEQLAIEHLLNNLDPENLATLRGIFQDLVNDTAGRLAAYYQGVCAAILRVKYDRCPGCGKQHDSLEQLLADHAASAADSDEANQRVTAASSSEIMLTDSGPMGEQSLFANPDAHRSNPSVDVYVDVDKELVGQKGLIPADLQSKMIEYNLDDLRDEDTGEILGFICIKCGLKYQSVADRMVKDPDDCHGCHLKSGWG